MRAFIAVELPVTLRDRLQAVQEDLRGEGAAVSWEHPEKMHLTLRFLGEIAENLRLDFVPPPGPFDVELAGLGSFGWKVLWAGFRGSLDPLHRLAKEADRWAIEADLPPDARAWHPHVTLGRPKSPEAARKLQARIDAGKDKIFGSWRMTRCVLMKSVLAPGGSTYSVVRDYEL